PAPAGAGPRQRWDQVAAGHAFGLRAALPAHCPHHADTVGDAERGGLQHGPELLVYARSHYELGVDRGDDLGWSTLGHHPLDGTNCARPVDAVDAYAQDADGRGIDIICRCRAGSSSVAISHV